MRTYISSEHLFFSFLCICSIPFHFRFAFLLLLLFCFRIGIRFFCICKNNVPTIIRDEGDIFSTRKFPVYSVSAIENNNVDICFIRIYKYNNKHTHSHMHACMLQQIKYKCEAQIASQKNGIGHDALCAIHASLNVTYRLPIQ